MTWTKLSDTFNDDPRLLQLERGARLLHVEGLVWANRHSTDGHVPLFALAKVTDEPDAELAAQRLVEAGLWAKTRDGFEIVDFLDEQPSAAAVATQRERRNERQRRWRERQNASRDASRNGNGDASKDAAPPRPAPPRKKRGGEGLSVGPAGGPASLGSLQEFTVTFPEEVTG